jgi:putative phosphoesterase
VTKLAILSDVHADVHALRDALAQIDRIGIERIACCGDLVDYGLFVEETLALLRDRGVACIRGNHDRWAIDGGADTSGWDLSAASISFLASLPDGWSARIDDVRIVLAHARPGSDMAGIALDAHEHELEEILSAAQADILIVGHTHVPFVRRLRDGRSVCNPGALLRDPAPGCDVATPGTFGVLDAAAREFIVVQAKDGAIVTCV